MSSYQVGRECYSSPLAAAQAAAAGSIGSLLQVGTASYVVDVSAVTASSITYRLQNVSSTASITKVASFTPLPCGLLDTSDGLVIAWGIAAAWLAVAGVLFIRRGLNT
jgi:hypothetical protein